MPVPVLFLAAIALALALAWAAIRIRADARELARLRAHGEQLSARLQDAQRAAHALRSERQAFEARAGHELRNPLNGLCAAIEVLEACAPGDPNAAEALGVASRQARRLVQRVDELLPRTGDTRSPAD